MINQIRADFYRQGRTLGILILAILIAAYSAITCGLEAPGGIMVNEPTNLINQLVAKNWTISDGVKGVTLSSSVLMYLFIALFVIAVGYEFSQHVYKNTLVTGISRLGFVLGKYFVMLIDIFLGVAWYYLVALLTGIMAGRKLGTSVAHLATFTCTALLVTTFFISVVFSLAMVLLVITKSLVSAAVFIVVWPVIIAIVGVMSKWHWIVYFDFFSAASGISFNTLSRQDTWRSVIVSVIVLIGSIVAASVVARRQEL